MPGMTVANHVAGPDIEGGEQRCRAMARIVVRPALDLPWPHRQERRATIQGLNLTFLVDAQDERARRRMKVEPDDVAHLLDEQRILRERERLGAMRLQRKGLPNAGHRRLRHAAMCREGPCAPMRRVPWRRFQRRNQDAFHVGIGDLAGRPRPRLIEQAIEPLSDEAMAPAGHGRFWLPATRGRRR